VADDARSSAGQRKAGMEASWFSSVRACLRVGRILVFLVSWYLICANSKLDGKITHGVGVKQPMSGSVGASESEALAPAPSHRSSPADVLRGESSVDCFPGVFCSDHPLRNYHSCRSVAKLCFPLPYLAWYQLTRFLAPLLPTTSPCLHHQERRCARRRIDSSPSRPASELSPFGRRYRRALQ